MRFSAPVGPLLLSLASAAAIGCRSDSTGPGGSGNSSPNFIRLVSDPGDWVGSGKTYEYTQASSIISVNANGAHLSVSVSGEEGWNGDFQLPSTNTRLEPGTYTGGLSWYGGNGCNTYSGSFTIGRATYDGTNLTAIDLAFEQHCEGAAAALHGTIHWRSDDTTRPPGPVNPDPPGLWAPAPGSTPPSGNYIYLTSDMSDWVGAGQTYLYTPTTATVTLTATGGLLSISVSGAEWWFGDFQAMNSIPKFEVGYYGNLGRYPFHNPTRGGLDWFGQGRGCNTLRGWFSIDHVTYAVDSLTAVDLRFEQHCEAGTSALHGAIHWVR